MVDLSIIINTRGQVFIYALGIGLLTFLIIRYQYRVLKRTRKLLSDKVSDSEEIERQRKELEIINKSITDSLTYASYIQKALLPSEGFLRKLLPESFILFKPKEIVSGDFYWAGKCEGRTYIVAADCTGHGVPGAFISMIGVELLNKIILDQKIKTASTILTMLSQGINRTFQGNAGETNNLKDGIDIGLCVIDKEKQNLEFAGAFFPLYIIRDNKLTEIKGDRFTVGLSCESEFKNNTLKLNKGDVIYMFSDGYADQFGGADDKKFMYRRFRHLLLTIHRFPMEEQKRLLMDSIDSWIGDREQVDDIMVIGVSN